VKDFCKGVTLLLRLKVLIRRRRWRKGEENERENES